MNNDEKCVLAVKKRGRLLDLMIFIVCSLSFENNLMYFIVQSSLCDALRAFKSVCILR